MARLNYRYLEYFWAVAKEGSVSRAAAAHYVTQPAISAQIRKLEQQLGEQLFRKSGRGLVLTEAGHVVYRYAEEIFGLGRELTEALRGQPGALPQRLRVGVVDAVPKLVAYRLLGGVLHLEPRMRLVVREGPADRLYADLAVHALDLVLSDTPLPAALNVKAFNHLLGECSVSVLGVGALAGPCRAGFPESLQGAPLLLPTDNTTLRRSLDRWLDEIRVQPVVVAEIEDSAVLKVFGQEGAGLFVVPSVMEEQVCRQYGVELAGRVPAVREQFYAVSVERRLRHPGVLAITDAARHEMFVDQAASRGES